jgi:hypothetical protein
LLPPPVQFIDVVLGPNETHRAAECEFIIYQAELCFDLAQAVFGDPMLLVVGVSFYDPTILA